MVECKLLIDYFINVCSVKFSTVKIEMIITKLISISDNIKNII